MIDINLLRQDPDFFKKTTRDKGFDELVVDNLLRVDKKRRELLSDIGSLRARKNKLTEKDRDEGKKIKLEIKNKELEFEGIDRQYKELMLKIPNPSAPDVKVGSPEENEVLRQVGKKPQFDFEVKDHLEIGELTDTIDIKRGAKVAQSGFYYLKGDGALLELALIRFAFDKLVKHGFLPVITPNVAKERNIVGCGFQARSEKERQIYHVEGEDLDLIATAEITLVGMHTDEVFEEKDLPKTYVGFSSCYRTEAGSYGKDVRGIMRVHEFRKIEMVVFCLPEESDKWHDKLLSIEEEIWKDLEIPYRVVKMATGDLGNAAARKYDIEAWIPSQNKYREVTSTSNTTDFQARRLNIKFRRKGSLEYVHTLNGTVLAFGRAMVALYENYQNEDGSVNIPSVLRPYFNKEKIDISSK